MGGVTIPHLSATDRQKINGKPDLQTIQQHYESLCNIGSSISQEQLKVFLTGFKFLGDEYEDLHRASKTYKISIGLISKNKQDQHRALWTMGQLVLQDLQQVQGEMPLAYYLECTRKFTPGPNQPFLTMDKGDNLISFEPPFISNIYSQAKGWVYDAPPEGMYMSWAMKYIITLDQAIQVTGFGLIFNQVCTDKSRLSKGPYLAHLFKQLLAKIGEKGLDGFNDRQEARQEANTLEASSSAQLGLVD